MAIRARLMAWLDTGRGRIARLLLLGLIVCCLALPGRLLWLLRKPAAAVPATEVEGVSLSLASGQGFRDAFGRGTGPTAHAAPLYSAYLGGLFRLCGTGPRERLVQGVVSIAAWLAGLLLLPWAARAVGLGQRAAWLAALLAAAVPLAHHSEVTGVHETTWMALDLVALTAALGTLHQQGWQRRGPVLASGVLLGLTAITSPVLLAGAALQILVSLARLPDRRRIVSAALVPMLAVAVLIVSPWAVRNAVVFGAFIPTRSNVGLELAIGNCDGADGRTYGADFNSRHPWGSAAEKERLTALGEDAYMREKRDEAVHWIAAHPRRFARLTLHRTWIFVFAPAELWPTPMSRSSWILMLLHGALAMLALVGLARLAYQRKPEAAVLAVLLLGLVLPYALTHVELRYRVPLPLLLALPAADLLLACLSPLRRCW